MDVSGWAEQMVQTSRRSSPGPSRLTISSSTVDRTSSQEYILVCRIISDAGVHRISLLTLSFAFFRCFAGTIETTFSTTTSAESLAFSSSGAQAMACSASKIRTLLVATVSALPEVATRVLVTRAYSLVAVGMGSSLSDSRTVMVREPTPLRFLTLEMQRRAGSPSRFDIVEEEDGGLMIELCLRLESSCRLESDG